MNKQLRQQWVTAGYGDKMGSGEVVPPPPKDILRSYHITSAEFAISDIGLGRMKVARFSDLNDPFELMALNFRERPARRTISDFKNEYDSHTGLLCFSMNWTNPVLWSHYGAKHRGICLGFDVPRILVERVKYEDQRILRSFGSGDPRQLDTELQGLLRSQSSNIGSMRKNLGGSYPLMIRLEKEACTFIRLTTAFSCLKLFWAHNATFRSMLCDDLRKCITAMR